MTGPFQFDDYVTVASDPGARSFAAWWDHLGSHVRPLLKASFVITGALGAAIGDVPMGHRIGNLVIHLAAIVAFHRLGVRASELLEPWRDVTARNVHASVAAAVFALHPLTTEAVSYISARSCSLATLASVMALLAWMNAREARGGLRIAWVGAGLASYAIACASREVAVLTPILWLLIEWLRSAVDVELRARRRTLQALAFAIALGGVVFVAWLLNHPRYGPLLDLSTRILAARIHEPVVATALGYLGCVAALVCAPNIDPAPSPAGAVQAIVLLGSLVVAGVVAFRFRRRQPMVLVMLAWAALWLLPIYLLPIRHDIVAERHAYPAVWSLGWLAGAIVVPLMTAQARALRWTGGVLALLLVTVLALLSAVRNHEYRSEVSLWEAAARESPEKVRVLNNLGAAYVDAGHWADAERVLRKARNLEPGNEIVEFNLDRALRRSPH